MSTFDRDSTLFQQAVHLSKSIKDALLAEKTDISSVERLLSERQRVLTELDEVSKQRETLSPDQHESLKSLFDHLTQLDEEIKSSLKQRLTRSSDSLKQTHKEQRAHHSYGNVHKRSAQSTFISSHLEG